MEDQKNASGREGHVFDKYARTPRELVDAYGAIRKNAMAEGSLSRKEKELIAVGITVAEGCGASIAYHVHNALEAGATREEIAEAVGVSMFTAGEQAHVHGLQLLEALVREGDPYPRHPRGFEHHPYMSPD